MGRDAAGGSVARHLRRAIGRDPTEGRGTPICSLLCMPLALLRGIKILVTNVDGQGRRGFILLQQMIRATEQGLPRFTSLGGGMNGCAAVRKLWRPLLNHHGTAAPSRDG